MSTQRGNMGKKGPPRHQNSKTWAHNKNSKKTAQIAHLNANVGLCQKCQGIMEWKKKYRKYKPLKRPSKCGWCHQSTVLLAYHTICKPCGRPKKVCCKCLEPFHSVESELPALTEANLQYMLSQAVGMKERDRRNVMRNWKNETTTDAEVYAMFEDKDEVGDDDEGEGDGDAGDAGDAAAGGDGAAGEKDEKTKTDVKTDEQMEVSEDTPEEI